MSLKKSITFIFIIMALFCLGKTSLIFSAAENSGYIVLINDESAPISFAGIKYALSDDLKNLSIEFQVMDAHTYEGQQGIHFSVICGDEKDEIFVNSDSITRTDPSFFSLENTVNEIDVFDSHSNVKIAFDLSFDKKITDNIILEAIFIDAAGVCTEKTTCVLYNTQEPSKSSTEVKESTTGKKEITSQKIESTAEQESVTTSKKSTQYSYSKNNGNSYSIISYSQDYIETDITDVSDTMKGENYNSQRSVLGVQQIVAIILAVFLIAAAIVCIIIGIKKSKVN